jgi:valyl-tRNA synthetase
LLRLLAPITPFVTEEVWSWWQTGSIHTAPWPTSAEFGPALSDGDESNDRVLEVAAEVLGRVRRAKTTAKRSMRSEVATLTVTDSAERIAALLSAEDDLRDAGGVRSLVTTVADQASVEVVLADEE